MKAFEKAPGLYQLDGLVRTATANSLAMSRDGQSWFPARPCGFYSIGSRIRLGWMVFTGRADAVVWPAGQ